MRIIKLQKKFIIYLLFFLITATAGATEYIQEPFPSDHAGVSIHGEGVVELEATEISYWQFLLWLATVHVLVLIDLLYPARLFLAVTGYRIVDPSNILDNPSRSKVYAYIKTRPGAYISEIVEQIGLDRGTVKYHVKTLKAKKKIEAYKDGGKIRYFENFFAYNEEERKVISALQNVTNQRIISGIINGKCDTNVALAHEFGVSRATISWYIKNLREVGLISEMKEGRRTIYSINHSYELLVEKHVHQMQDSFNEEWLQSYDGFDKKN
jgi:predicted transcriptional regulator